MPFVGWLLARPMVIGGIAILGFIGVRETQHFFDMRGIRKDLATLQAEFDQERLANASLRQGLTESQANNAQLVSTIKQMNSNLELAAAKTRQIEAAANLRVARAVKAGQDAARELRAPDTHIPPGHLAMNSWLQERMAQ